jgi:hypothetical protein
MVQVAVVVVVVQQGSHGLVLWWLGGRGQEMSLVGVQGQAGPLYHAAPPLSAIVPLGMGMVGKVALLDQGLLEVA